MTNQELFACKAIPEENVAHITTVLCLKKTRKECFIYISAKIYHLCNTLFSNIYRICNRLNLKLFLFKQKLKIYFKFVFIFLMGYFAA